MLSAPPTPTNNRCDPCPGRPPPTRLLLCVARSNARSLAHTAHTGGVAASARLLALPNTTCFSTRAACAGKGWFEFPRSWKPVACLSPWAVLRQEEGGGGRPAPPHLPLRCMLCFVLFFVAGHCAWGGVMRFFNVGVYMCLWRSRANVLGGSINARCRQEEGGSSRLCHVRLRPAAADLCRRTAAAAACCHARRAAAGR